LLVTFYLFPCDVLPFIYFHFVFQIFSSFIAQCLGKLSLSEFGKQHFILQTVTYIESQWPLMDTEQEVIHTGWYNDNDRHLERGHIHYASKFLIVSASCDISMCGGMFQEIQS